jgi:hypothetical protein
MAQRRLAGSPARPGWQRPQLAVSLAVVLVAASIGAVLLSRGPARDVGPPTSPSAASWNSADTAYVLAMLWHQQQECSTSPTGCDGGHSAMPRQARILNRRLGLASLRAHP